MQEVLLPPPPEDLLEESNQWAHEEAMRGMRDSLYDFMLGTYYKGFAIYQEHRRTTLERIEDAGGVKKIKYQADPISQDILGEHRQNRLVLKDGSVIPLRELVAIEPIESPLETPKGLPEKATRVHQVQLGFGGKAIGMNAEAIFEKDIDHKFVEPGKPFERFLGDPTYFPEDMGITERIVTDKHPDPDDEGFRWPLAHQVSRSYSLDGRIWRPSLDKDIPDYRSDPLGYRAWALRGDAKLELAFQAPVIIQTRDNFNGEKISYRGMKTVIDYRNNLVTSGTEASSVDIIELFKHYTHLMDIVYVTYVPEETRATVDREIAEIIGQKPALQKPLPALS